VQRAIIEMVQAGITAIVFGVMLMVLGMTPSLITALIQGLQNFRDYFSLPRDLGYNVADDIHVSRDIWLVVGGGVLVIAGLTSLLWSGAFF
jgi:hypothetical protein